MKTPPLFDLVASFLQRHGLAGTTGVVALSGGPDSIALALTLHHLRQQGILDRLVLAHVNHQLRGEESDGDEAFVTSLANQWGCPFQTHRVDTAAEAERTGDNLETTARRLRYDWLAEVAQADGAAWVATGHSADDQAETVLHRLLRGAGLQGLGGMAETRPLAPGIALIRPLLQVRRANLLAFLDKHQQSYRLDSSNQDQRFTRNRLRLEVLPLLAQDYNPVIVEILCRLAEQAREAQEIIARLASRLLAEVELPRAGGLLVLAAENLAKEPRHLVREMFRLLWTREGWPTGAMRFAWWDRLAALANDNEGVLEMPDGMRARRVGQVIQLGRM